MTDFLELLNEKIIGLDRQLEPEGTAYPPIFVIGAPRSGTTYLTQLLAACTEVGIIDNLAASFWNAPITGAMLSKKLVETRVYTGCSSYGRTRHISEPHEFGRFWLSRLGHAGLAQPCPTHEVEWEPLLAELDALSRVFDAPMLFKVFSLTWHLSEFHALRPGTKWIWITRDLKANAESLLKLRTMRIGNGPGWVSTVPRRAVELYQDYPPDVQVCAQIRLLNEWIKEELDRIPADNWVHVSLDDLQRDAHGTIQTVCRDAGIPHPEDMLGKLKWLRNA